MCDSGVTSPGPDRAAAERSRGGAPPETPDLCGAYPRLDDAQITALAALGQRRAVQPGEVLFREGDRNCDFFVILSGEVAVVEGHDTAEEHVIGVHGRGRFLGELGLLTGETAFYSATAVGPGEVLTVPAERLTEFVTHDPALGDLILRACLIRRSILIGLGVGLRIVGSRYSPDSRRLRDFAARNRLPCRWLDLEQDPGAEALLRELGVAPEDTPIVILYGQRLLRNPSNAELAAAIGLPAPTQPGTACDLLVVGAGPAGLSAAVYGAAEGMDTVILDGTATGGQAGTSSRIENYLGFPSGISGAELAARAVIQARKFGARFAVPAEAVSLEHSDGHFQARLGDDTSVSTRCVIIGTGVRYRRLDVPRLEHFEKTSVYYAASQAEALVCRGDPVVIVGGGNSAGQATVFLARHVAKLTLVVREKNLAESMSRYLIDQIERIANVEVLLGTEIRELLGDQALEAVLVEDGQAGATRTIEARALFVFIGAAPCTSWLGTLVDLDDRGYIKTGGAAEPAPRAGSESEDSWRPTVLETSQPGILAVGDVRSGSVKRVASAVGDGAMAVRLALEHMHFG